MEFSFSEDQQAVRELARQIFSDRVTDDYHRQGAAAPDLELWRTLAEAGLLGVALPESCGGSGFGVLELGLVLEEQGRVLAPVPLLHSLALVAPAILRFGSEAQRQQWLPPLARGEHYLTAALVEVAAEDRTALPRARSVDAGWELDGVLEQVPYAEGAAAVLVPAVDGDDALRWFLVPPQAAGVSLDAQPVTHHEPRWRLRLDGVSVAGDAALGGPGQEGDTAQGDTIAEAILQLACTGTAALTLGVAEEALRRTAVYTTERTQFGKPLAAFQAVSHRAADGYVDIEALRSVYWQALWRLAAEGDAGADARTAKWWAAEVAHRVGHTAQHLHGGIGADVDYPIHRYYLWGKGLEFSLGGARRQLAGLGALLARDSQLGARI